MQAYEYIMLRSYEVYLMKL